MKIPHRFRQLNRLYAKLKGAFWTTCPICVQWFGGHEAAPLGTGIWCRQGADQKGLLQVCWKCKGEARRIDALARQHCASVITVPMQLSMVPGVPSVLFFVYPPDETIYLVVAQDAVFRKGWKDKAGRPANVLTLVIEKRRVE